MRDMSILISFHRSANNQAGSGYYELVAAIPPIVAYTGPPSSPEWAAVLSQESALQSKLLAYLNGHPDITVYGETSADAALRLPVVSFRVAGRDSRELVEALERTTRYGFRWGAFYSHALVRDVLGLGADGVVRVSMAHYNTGEWSNLPNLSNLPLAVQLLSCLFLLKRGCVRLTRLLYSGGDRGLHQSDR